MTEPADPPATPAPGRAPGARADHWADRAAARTIAAHPEADVYVCAAGITPSGVVHVGNFREVITVDLVARALRDRGVEVRFIYSWDDFDVFRKVPKGMPEPEMLADNLRRSIADVPDPYGVHDSYASHNIAQFEASIEPLGISPEFIRQSRRYRAGDYAEGIRSALQQRDVIASILNAHRTTPLADDWLPLAGFCAECGRDEIDFTWDGEWSVHVRCRTCSHENDVNLREGGDIKLPWRVDWPMRWAAERVLFEPGGKDHSSAGGSYDTGREIVATVYDWVAPEYVAYDFIGTKGAGGKISSSAGGVVTVGHCLEIYEPQVLRWMFASYRPNTEFSISFDLDVIKIYEDFDRAFRLAHQPLDGGKKDKKRAAARRVMELAAVTDADRPREGEPVFRPAFRPLSLTVQVYDGDLDRVVAHYERSGEITSDHERALLRQRAACVWNWVERYAPDEFRYRIRSEPASEPPGLEGELATALRRVVEGLESASDDAQVIDAVKHACDGLEIGRQEFFPVMYELLIGRPKGPRLTTLVATMGAERALHLLRPGLA
jgi:lysyl-tRNA synthetase class 1